MTLSSPKKENECHGIARIKNVQYLFFSFGEQCAGHSAFLRVVPLQCLHCFLLWWNSIRGKNDKNQTKNKM